MMRVRDDGDDEDGGPGDGLAGPSSPSGAPSLGGVRSADSDFVSASSSDPNDNFPLATCFRFFFDGCCP